ncbi:MAG TPA: hypothetical protein DDZ89_19225 [Clostridiales bacterium]|nr:hypothetical protein [Clostridiales bacterium]
MAKTILPDLLSMPDCSSLSDNGKCKRLNVTKCRGEKCPFKKSNEEENVSRERSFLRIMSLDKSKQIHIAKKYFSGNMPWESFDKKSFNI